MASSALEDFWPDLARLGSTDANGRDARARLLTLNAEMFVAAPARDREAVETFESLALGFLPTVDDETLVAIARILTPCADTPETVLAYLLRYSPHARDVVIDHGRHAPEDLAPKMFGTRDGRMTLAASSAITADTAQKLLVLEDDSLDDILAGNRHFAACEKGFSQLLARGRRRAALAHILLAREDLAADGEAALYLAASRERRAGIRRALADAIAHRRATLSFNLTDADVETLLKAARAGDALALEEFFTTAFGFPDTADWRLLRIGRHELLALALKALGIGRRDATRIFIDLHPALAHPLSAIRRLVKTVREVESDVALALVEAILDVRALSARD